MPWGELERESTLARLETEVQGLDPKPAARQLRAHLAELLEEGADDPPSEMRAEILLDMIRAKGGDRAWWD